MNLQEIRLEGGARTLAYHWQQDQGNPIAPFLNTQLGSHRINWTAFFQQRDYLLLTTFEKTAIKKDTENHSYTPSFENVVICFLHILETGELKDVAPWRTFFLSWKRNHGVQNLALIST